MTALTPPPRLRPRTEWKFRLRPSAAASGAPGRQVFLEEKRRGDSVWKRRVEIGVGELDGFAVDADPADGRGWYRARLQVLQMRPVRLISSWRRVLRGAGVERLTVGSRLRAAASVFSRMEFEAAGAGRPDALGADALVGATA